MAYTVYTVYTGIERLHEVWLPWKVNKKRVATPIHFNKITELTSLAGALYTVVPWLS